MGTGEDREQGLEESHVGADIGCVGAVLRFRGGLGEGPSFCPSPRGPARSPISADERCRSDDRTREAGVAHTRAVNPAVVEVRSRNEEASGYQRRATFGFEECSSRTPNEVTKPCRL